MMVLEDPNSAVANNLFILHHENGLSGGTNSGGVRGRRFVLLLLAHVTREQNRDNGPNVALGTYLDRTSRMIDNLLYHGKPEARPVFLGFRGEEGLEDLVLDFGID